MARILVVDDYPVALRVMAHTLRPAGHEVVAADRGMAALTILENERVDLAIIDLAMPEMGGLELLVRLRADARWRQLPVIMLTASGQDSDRLAARAAGADAFLTKPAGSREVRDLVNQLLGAGHEAATSVKLV